MTWQPTAHAAEAHKAMQRAQALTIPCAYCNAPTGQPCAARNGTTLEYQPAHIRRLKDSGAT